MNSTTAKPQPHSLPQHHARVRAREEGMIHGRRRGGRPVQITVAVAEAIGALVAKGMPERAACHLMSPPVNHESFRAARRRNPLIGRVIEQAQAEFIAHALEVIRTDGQGSTGLQWILERRHPEDFARQVVRRPVNG